MFTFRQKTSPKSHARNSRSFLHNSSHFPSCVQLLHSVPALTGYIHFLASITSRGRLHTRHLFNAFIRHICRSCCIHSLQHLIASAPQSPSVIRFLFRQPHGSLTLSGVKGQVTGSRAGKPEDNHISQGSCYIAHFSIYILLRNKSGKNT